MDYYANGVGLLQGQPFEHVGMRFREVDLAILSALEQNLNPETGEKSGLQLLMRRPHRRVNWAAFANEAVQEREAAFQESPRMKYGIGARR